MGNQIHKDIDIHSARRAPRGGGIIYELWLDAEDDTAKLPALGEAEAASTSTAFIKSTGRVLALGKDGWSEI